MNTKVAWIAVAVVIVLAAAWYLVSAGQVAAPTEENMPVNESAQVSEEALPAADSESEIVVTLTDAGFTPATVSIAAGESVRFINQSSRGMWVGSDDHPTHTAYDGTTTREHCANGAVTNGTFDQCTQVPKGQSWDYTFLKKGTFKYHNHTGASSVGTVVVE